MHIIKLNLARNCIKYLIRQYGIKEIFVPYYTCPVVWRAIRQEGCRIKFYHINSDFMPSVNFGDDDYILYTNYFGLCERNCRELSKKYKNLIVDNSHSYYSQPSGLASFNSLRKFFDVQNGAYLYTNAEPLENLVTDSLDIGYVSPQNDYDSFCRNEKILDSQTEIKYISPAVENLISQINFEQDRLTRCCIFKKYNEKFCGKNKIKLTLEDGEIPYCYPFSPTDIKSKNELLKKGVTIIKLWEDMPFSSDESTFLDDVAMLPLNIYSEILLS